VLKGTQSEIGTTSKRNFTHLILLLSVSLFATLIPAQAGAQPKAAHPLKQDESCLACHGQPGMTSAGGKSISIDPAGHAASVHGSLACIDCHTTIKDFPHADRVPKVRCLSCHADEASHVSGSIHAALGELACQSCHGDPHEVAAAAQTVPVKCAQCHAEEVKDLRKSIHGQAAARGDPDAPNCGSCHGVVHQIQAENNAASPVAKKSLPDTCASCHSNPQFLARHKIPFAHPVELYKQSVHGRAIVDGDRAAATCSDCHGSHGILPSQDARSKVNHWNIATTCGQCHAEISKTYLASVHGQAMKAGVSAAPVCSDCHGEHLILGPADQASLVNSSRVSLATCGRCHSDERLALRYNLPADRVPSYADSYHGLAQRGGSQSVANCASCHGVHDIFPSKDARSTVNAANLPRTCGSCHAGAGDHFVIGPVHVQTASGPANASVKWVRWTYWILIPLTLGFMILHNLLDLLAKLIRRRPRNESGARVSRMNLNFRIAHWVRPNNIGIVNSCRGFRRRGISCLFLSRKRGDWHSEPKTQNNKQRQKPFAPASVWPYWKHRNHPPAELSLFQVLVACGAECHVVRLVFHQQIGLSRRMWLVAGQAGHWCFHLGRIRWIQQVRDWVPRHRMSRTKFQRQHHYFVLSEIIIRKFHTPVEDGQQVFGFQLLRLGIWSVAFEAQCIRALGTQQMVILSPVWLVTGGTTLTESGLMVNLLFPLVGDIGMAGQADLDSIGLRKPRLAARMGAVAIRAVTRCARMRNFGRLNQLGLVVMASHTQCFSICLRQHNLSILGR
jgi:hypothetical protein